MQYFCENNLDLCQRHVKIISFQCNFYENEETTFLCNHSKHIHNNKLEFIPHLTKKPFFYVGIFALAFFL